MSRIVVWASNEALYILALAFAGMLVLAFVHLCHSHSAARRAAGEDDDEDDRRAQTPQSVTRDYSDPSGAASVSIGTDIEEETTAEASSRNFRSRARRHSPSLLQEGNNPAGSKIIPLVQPTRGGDGDWQSGGRGRGDRGKGGVSKTFRRGERPPEIAARVAAEEVEQFVARRGALGVRSTSSRTGVVVEGAGKGEGRRVGDVGEAVHGDESAGDEAQRCAAAAKQGQNAEEAIPDCPICLSVVEHAVVTHCGHAFCGECFLDYWQSASSSRRRVRCPLDRQEVFAVYPHKGFRQTSMRQAEVSPETYEAKLNHAANKAQDLREPVSYQAEVSPETYEAKVLQLQTLYERKRLMREQHERLLRHERELDARLSSYNYLLRDSWLQENSRWAVSALWTWRHLPLRVQQQAVAYVCVCVVYLLAPVDVLSERMLGPVFGLLDDLLLPCLLFAIFGGFARDFLTS